jgi:hypothetical protein
LGLVAAFQKGAIDEAFASILEIVFVPPDADLGGFKRLSQAVIRIFPFSGGPERA